MALLRKCKNKADLRHAGCQLLKEFRGMVPCSNTTVIYIHGVEISQQTVHYSRTTRISTTGMRNTSRNTESRTVTAIVSPILMFLSSNCYSTPNALNTSCGGGARWHRNALVWSNNRSHYRQTCSAQCSAAVVIIFLYRRRYAGVARSAAANTPGSRLRCGAARRGQSNVPVRRKYICIARHQRRRWDAVCAAR